MNDPDQMLSWPVLRDELADHRWDYDGLAATEDRATVDPKVALTSLAFIKSALRRRAWLWGAIAAAGLLIGLGLYVKFPPGYKATTSVLLADNPNQDSAVEVLTDQALAESSAVAGKVVSRLGLTQTVGSFQGSYQVAVVTNQVLQFTVNAPSDSEALRRASALASAFLQYRASYTLLQQQQTLAQLNQQANQAQQRFDSVSRQVSQVSAEPTSPEQQARLRKLEAQRTYASNALAQVQQYVTNTRATTQTATANMVNDSRVLDSAALLPHSRIKGAALYVAGGLIGGVAVGIGLVIIMALVSDRLRSREDVAAAIGAPVRLSVGALHARRLLPGRGGAAMMRDRDTRLVVAHLHNAVPRSTKGGPAGLTVVAVDNAQLVAQVVVSLALSCVRQGRKVVLADLSGDARAARLLGTRSPGINAVSHNGVNLTVIVPDHDDIAPIGPLKDGRSAAMSGQPSEALAAACASADLVLTLAVLDPAFGGDHLATWATEAVAVVSAGQSSAEKVHAVGEMIRLAGTQLASVVLIGADKTDESLGVPRALDESVLATPV